MITVERGNVLKQERGFIVHGCNCKGVMGGGIALQIRNQFPAAYKAYKDNEANAGLMLGSISFAEVKPDLFIVNAYTQDEYGTYQRQVNYEAVAQCFQHVVTLAEDIVEARNTKLPIMFPKIGAGLAGGNWNIIQTIIDKTVPESFHKILFVFE